MIDERVKYAEKRLSALETKRQPYEKYWDKAAELCAEKSKIYIKDNNRIVQTLFDSTAINALTYFTSSMKSILAPTNQVYQRIKPSDPTLENNSNVYQFTEYVNNLIFKLRYSAKSNFSVQSDILLKNIGVYGISPFMIEEDIGKGVFYKTIPLDEIYCDVNRADKIDIVYRVYELTARQCMKEFGKKATQKMKETFEKDPEHKFKLLQAIEPRQDKNIKAKDYTGMDFVSYNIDLDNNELIYESGYRTQPIVVPRFDPFAGEAYGNSPALKAFNDLLTINEMGKTVLRTGQLQANPALLTTANMNNAQRAGTAGAVIYGGLNANGQPMIAPMQYGNNLSITLELQNQIREAIEAAFLKPLFLSLTQDKQMTAEEVRKRDAEKAQILAPMAERISNEWLVGTVEREIDIIRSYGLLDDVPDELMAEGSLKIEFESPMVRMQQAGQIQGLYETLESAMSMSQVQPEILDKINFAKALDIIAEYKGVNPAVLRSDEEVQAMGQARAQAQQAQQLLDAAPVLTQSMKNLKDASM